MNRVQSAIAEERCVIALGTRVQSDPEIMTALDAVAGLPWVSITDDAPGPIAAMSAESLQPALESQGGMVILLDPDVERDSAGLKILSEIMRAGSQKPRLFVVSKGFNPFQLPMSMRLMKLDQLKVRARDFVTDLTPVEEVVEEQFFAPTPRPEKAVPKEKKARAPHLAFHGRDALITTLGEALSQGGPLLLHGPSGVGKRWLLSVMASRNETLTCLPTLQLGPGVAFDSLVARLAELGSEETKALVSAEERPTPRKLIKALLASVKDDSLKKTVLPVSGLEGLLRRDGSFHRDDRLSMLLEALLGGDYALSVVFLTSRLPAQRTEGKTCAVLEVGGLELEAVEPIVAAYGIEGLTPEELSDIHERSGGHPLAIHALAIACREAESPQEVLGRKKFLRLGDVANIERLRARILSVIGTLSPSLREALSWAAHSSVPLSATVLTELGISRSQRISLLAQGLLQNLPEQENKSYYAHPLVRERLSWKEITRFALMEHLGNLFKEQAKALEGSESLALRQEANRLLVGARRSRSRAGMTCPDGDPAFQSARDMLRGRRQDLAEQTLNEALKLDAGNTEMQLLRIEIAIDKREDHKRIAKLYVEAGRICPTPELFHHEANWHLASRGGGAHSLAAAVRALERGVGRFPLNVRLIRRVAGMKLDGGSVDQAEFMARQATSMEGLVADSWSLLGGVLLAKGKDSWDEAEEVLEKALLLDGESASSALRLAVLLRWRGMVDEKKRVALWDRAEVLLDGAIQRDSRNGRLYLELGRLLLDRAQLGQDVDLEKAEKLLRAAVKQHRSRKAEAQVALSRVLSRTERSEEAAKLIQKALGKAPAHVTRAALGELLGFQGRVFRAEKEFREAWQQAPADAPEKELYRLELQRLEGLISSGAAVDIEKQAEGQTLVEPQLQARPGVRREPGKTVVRRKKKGKQAEEEVQAQAALPVLDEGQDTLAELGAGEE